MIITLNFQGNIYNLMRQCGYYPQGKDEKTGELSFVKKIGPSDYPHFHIYLKRVSYGTTINLHLDQKKPIYKGTSAHSAEYIGKVVEKEAERIKQSAGL